MFVLNWFVTPLALDASQNSTELPYLQSATSILLVSLNPLNLVKKIMSKSLLKLENFMLITLNLKNILY